MLLKTSLGESLCELSDYCKECYHYVTLDGFDLPSKPDAAIRVLRKNILYADNNMAKLLKQISDEYQVHNSRLQEFAENIARNKTENMITDIVVLNWCFLKLFDFTRNSSEKQIASIEFLDPDDQQLSQSLRNLFGGLHAVCDNTEEYNEMHDLVIETYKCRNVALSDRIKNSDTDGI